MTIFPPSTLFKISTRLPFKIKVLAGKSKKYRGSVSVSVQMMSAAPFLAVNCSRLQTKIEEKREMVQLQVNVKLF